MKIALVEDNGLHQAKIRQEIQNYLTTGRICWIITIP